MACKTCHSDCSSCEDYGLVLRTRRSPRAQVPQVGAGPVGTAFAAVAVPAQGPATPLSPQALPPPGSTP